MSFFHGVQMKSYTVFFFVDGKDGMKEIKVTASSEVEAIAAALSYMPGVNVTIVNAVEGR